MLTSSRGEMQQHGMRQVNYDTEVGKVTHRVLDVRRPIWSLGSMMDSGCDVHFTRDRCWRPKEDGKGLDMIRSVGVSFVAARPAKPTSREASTLELNPMTAAEVEQAALAREHAAFGVPSPAAEATLDCDGETTVRTKVSHGSCDALSCGKSTARGFGARAVSQLVSMVHGSASGGQAPPEGTATSNR